ncbi:MAG TPA: hypothetical protein VGN12_15230, partial [Pirellulales bacterium]
GADQAAVGQATPKLHSFNKPKNFPEAQPDPRRQRPNLFHIPVAFPRALFFFIELAFRILRF